MAGSWNLFDSVNLTSLSESSPRSQGIDTLQIHHATMISLSGLRGMMDPGGRTVSANGAMGNDGHLMEVVRTPDRRAFTSASSFDNRSLTVECCNLSVGGNWPIAMATRVRLANLAVGMRRAGILSGFHVGPGGLIGHNQVPGSYATACPGPDMDVPGIAALAQKIYNGGGSGTAGGGTTPIPPTVSSIGDFDMRLFRETNGTIFFATSAGVVGIRSQGHYILIDRFLKLPPHQFDTFNAAERDIIISYINEAQNDNVRQKALITAIATANDDAQIAAAVADIKATVVANKPVVDSAIVAKAVADAVKAELGDVAIDVDYTKVGAAAATAVDAALQDNFAGIPDAVVNEQRDRLES